MIAHSVDEPFYYLHNFQQVLGWIELRYADLLDAQERAFIQQFRQQPRAAQALLVRMVMRKGLLFRPSKLVYAEIGSPQAALEPLLAMGWVVDDSPLSLEQLFDLLRKDELATGFSPLLSRPRAAKSELLAQLQALELPARPLHEWLPGFAEPVIELRLQALCDRLRLLFFGNLYKDWSEFVLADLGLMRYEQVAFSDDSRALRQRSDIEVALALHECGEWLEQGVALEQVVAEVDALDSDNPWLQRRRSRLLYQLGQHSERLADWPLALRIYPRSQHPQARIRHIRVLERSEQWAAAFELASQVARQPANAVEVQALARMLPRLQRKLGGPPQPRRAKPKVNLIDLTLPAQWAALGVEQAVQQHLEQDGGHVHYVENTLFNSLFGLLCWEAIFAPLPGAFFHPFQSAPQDLHDAEFYPRRRALFAQCLGQLDDGRYLHTIRRHFLGKQGLQSPFVYWQVLSEKLLEQALACLPAAHLKRCFERLLEDLQGNRSGMPDLIQFWPEQQRYRMIEVKGPGDRLQDSQLRWIEFCAEHGLPVDVCHVQWST
ncbi:VRR-NUC domain-containing protein [Pseudomonas rubra]|uniref:phosphodiesterase I n=1 Tax=Pseudomonas rubra TaxID=2942627 RepID=A0ABT5PA48_9PSED|nr:VRR-NUC domain-containing protein [Pseudomonas rubra]MDD1015176.1 VRR-NUC domain-containing protein [Pseudomonas rubra]MDD1037830.1 VRR-NUC domain-containing protein [Pseudomonas rubra]MDD1152841.1 VRR-NUC domain-containing protein [Pseudomonas rubra]